VSNDLSIFVDDVYFSRVATVVKNAIDEAIPVYQTLIEAISKVVQNAANLPDLQSAIQQLDPPAVFTEGFAALILSAMETSEALGRSLVVRRDEALTPQPIIGKLRSEDWFVCDDVVKVSFDIIPKDALEYLRQKSLSLAGVELEAVKEAVKQAIISAIEKGQTIQDFRAEIDSIFDSFGITKLSTQRIDLVYRMNTFAAYTIGEAKQVASMIDRFPLAKYSAIHDAKSRHIALEGFYHSDAVPLPPVDYNCRCSVIYIHISQVTGNEVVLEAPPRPDLIKFDQRDSF
jgi:hypothetical protein